MAEYFKSNGIICAVNDEEHLEAALKSKHNTIFLLNADINTVADVVRRCHECDKNVFIHLDLAVGIARDEAGIKFIAEHIRPEGILSTKFNSVRMAIECGLIGIYRVFLVDSQSMETALANIRRYAPCAVEIMPGVAYEAINVLHKQVDVNVIAGGFIRTRKNVDDALAAGARACSTTNMDLWDME